MYEYYNNQFQKNIIVIDPGEYYATSEDVYISTVLGSCVSVVLFDPTTRTGGMNHYMLPGEGEERQNDQEAGKYGVSAMHHLLQALFSLGCKKFNLKAKVFGGGAVLTLSARKSIDIPKTNVAFALDFLSRHSIPVIATDVYGTQGRKVFFSPITFVVKVKRLTKQAIEPVVSEEKQLLRELKEMP